MTMTQCVELLQAFLGAIGTIILFFNSYSLAPLEGAVWGSPEIDKHNQNIKKQNSARLKWQRAGFAFLCISFLIQFILIVADGI